MIEAMRYLILAFLAITSTVQGQYLEPVKMSNGYYVVVGVFRHAKNAAAFTESTATIFSGTRNSFNEENSLFYVYIAKTESKPDALEILEATRSNPDFRDAWLKIIQPPIIENVNIGPMVDPPVVVENEEPLDNYFNDEIVQYDHMDLGNTEVFLSLFNATNNRVVQGNIQVIDTERAKRIKDIPANEYLYLPNPQSKSGIVTLIAEAIGYRKVQHELHYNDPMSDTLKTFIELMGTTVLVNFDMVPFMKGDIQTLYHVYFFNDASVMMPESRYELNSLLAMMQDNPTARIRLHGHTNGNYHGKIIGLGPDKNFFSLTGSMQSSGSAMELAYMRAEVIKEWLTAQGIEPDSIEVRSWGGKKPLYDKHGANARKNVRVEVEKLAD